MKSAPALIVSLESPPCAPTPGDIISKSPIKLFTRATSSGLVAGATTPVAPTSNAKEQNSSILKIIY